MSQIGSFLVTIAYHCHCQLKHSFVHLQILGKCSQKYWLMMDAFIFRWWFSKMKIILPLLTCDCDWYTLLKWPVFHIYDMFFLLWFHTCWQCLAATSETWTLVLRVTWIVLNWTIDWTFLKVPAVYRWNSINLLIVLSTTLTFRTLEVCLELVSCRNGNNT